MAQYQLEEDNKLHPVTFDRRKLHGTELNYPTHEKELFTIKDALQKWYHYVKNGRLIAVSVGNRLSVTRHQPNRRPRFFDVVSSRLRIFGRTIWYRSSEICLKISRPISSSRFKTDETDKTNRFRVTKLKSQELSLLYNKMQFSCDTFPVTNRL